MDHRLDQVNSLLQEILAQLIAKEFCVTRDVIISVTRVATSGNFQEAKVYISVLPDNQRNTIVDALNRNVVSFQHTLNRKLRMRPVPRVAFIPDTKPEEAQKVETILEQLKNKNKD